HAGPHSDARPGSVYPAAAQGFRSRPRQSTALFDDPRYGLSLCGESRQPSGESRMSLSSSEPIFERKSEPLLSRGQFLGRMAAAVGVTLAIVAASLAMGMAGYHYLGGLP